MVTNIRRTYIYLAISKYSFLSVALLCLGIFYWLNFTFSWYFDFISRPSSDQLTTINNVYVFYIYERKDIVISFTLSIILSWFQSLYWIWRCIFSNLFFGNCWLDQVFRDRNFTSHLYLILLSDEDEWVLASDSFQEKNSEEDKKESPLWCVQYFWYEQEYTGCLLYECLPL